jgi:formylglycine-generating enzyme required for sulfatase activity
VPSNFAQRRHDLKESYAGVDEDIEDKPAGPATRPDFVPPPPQALRPPALAVPGWPLAPAAALQAQAALGSTTADLDLGDGVRLELSRIPAGTFAMGDVHGEQDEFPMAAVTIPAPFWMGTTEISLGQFRQFRKEQRNGWYDMHYKDQVMPGYLVDDPDFPVIRVSWDDAMAFCAWLSQKTGKRVTLPSEAQWEWACRAGGDAPLWYGTTDSDFAPFANLADRQLVKLAVAGVNPQPIKNPDPMWDFVPKDERFDDGTMLLAKVGSYRANPWGLKDMAGNVAEWTRDRYRPYPYRPDDGADRTDGDRMSVRGGSWYSRPKDARAAFRLAYPRWQRVYDVGFRVVVEGP